MNQTSVRLLTLAQVFTIFVIVLCVVIAVTVYEPPKKSPALVPGPQGEQGMTGPTGSDGLQGVPGMQGVPGQDGKNAPSVIEKQTIIEQGTQGAQGPQGEQGDIGPAGQEIELRNNPGTGDIEWRYSGDSIWTLLVDQCVLTNSCGP